MISGHTFLPEAFDYRNYGSSFETFSTSGSLSYESCEFFEKKALSLSMSIVVTHEALSLVHFFADLFMRS
jgi:hypothetical protein